MWILTQNEERILSTEGLDEIKVSDPMPGKTDYGVLIRRRADGKAFALGFYHRKEKAIAVLGEIFKAQSSFFGKQEEMDLTTGGFRAGNVVIPPKTYVMPPDEIYEVQ